MSQNNNAQDEDEGSKPNSNLDLLNIDEGDIQVKSNLNLIEIGDDGDRQSELSKTGHGWVKEQAFYQIKSAMQVDMQQTQTTLDGLMGNNFADRVKQMHLMHEEEELVLDDKDPKQAKLRQQLLKRKVNNESRSHKRNVTEDLDNIEKKSTRNLLVPSQISKRSGLKKK